MDKFKHAISFVIVTFLLMIGFVSCSNPNPCHHADSDSNELCDLCGEDKGAISRYLDFLESNGFITACPVEGKKYKTPLSLTEKGREAANVICQKIDSILDRVGEGVSDEHRKIMYSALNTINENLKSICSDYTD